MDLYQLTMAASFLSRGMTQPATFSLFVRKLPPDRQFLVSCGLDATLDALERFHLDDDDLRWLEGQGFSPDAVAALGRLWFTGDVMAIPEGRVVFADEPLLEITAPLPEAQVVEALVLNQITYQTALASKAARCQLAAAGRAELVDFALRRTHGIEAALAAARAAGIAGFAGTSNVDAARRLGMAPVGTMAHSYVTAFPDERKAFVAFAEDFPDRRVFLVDTYDTVAGVDAAIDAIRAHRFDGPLGIRLDSGDLLALSVVARRRLDRAGLHQVRIVASGGIDEFEITRLLDAGAPIDTFGVGTKVGIAADAPSLDSAYKLVEYDGRPMMKLSPGKLTRPGPKQVYRKWPGNDVLATREEEAPAGAVPLLVPVITGGRRISSVEDLATIRDRLASDLAHLPPGLASLRGRTSLPPRPSDRLAALTEDLTAQLRMRHVRPHPASILALEPNPSVGT